MDFIEQEQQRLFELCFLYLNRYFYMMGALSVNAADSISEVLLYAGNLVA